MLPSTRFDLAEGLMVLLTGPAGRMLKYDPAKKSSTVLMDGLAFANGIVLSDKEDYVLVSECGRGQERNSTNLNAKLPRASTLFDIPSSSSSAIHINCKGAVEYSME